MKDTKEKLSRLTIALHWLVGLTIIGLITVGIYMKENEAFALYPIHKSVGVLVFAFVLWRVVWRAMNGWPVPAGDYSTLEHILAKVVHWTLIAGTVLFPISGFVMSAAGGHGVAVLGVELVAANPDPANPGEVIALNAGMAGFAHNMHGILGNVMIAAILLHMVGAFKHHLSDRDGTLRRMLGARV